MSTGKKTRHKAVIVQVTKANPDSGLRYLRISANTQQVITGTGRTNRTGLKLRHSLVNAGGL